MKPKFHGSSFVVASSCHPREDPREDVARVGLVGEDVTRMYEETAPVEFKLNGK